MKEMYGALLPYVNHRADLNYLHRHDGRRDRDRPLVRARRRHARGRRRRPAGLLGADFAIENGRYRITKIYDDESWNPDLRAPLAAPGVDVRVGDYILAINGVELKAPRQHLSPARRHGEPADGAHRERDADDGRRAARDGRAGRERAGAAHARVGGAQPPHRRLAVARHSSRTSICRTPAQPGYTSFNRYYFAQQDKKGAIIDERYNGGGSAADYIIDVLQRDFDGYFNNVAGERYAVHAARRRASGGRR